MFSGLSPPGFPARSVRVYAPYDSDPTRARPALFLFDGQNVFGDHGSFAGGWHADTAVDKLTARTVQAPLVVGIDHGHQHRLAELSAFAVGGAPGRADAFLDWVTTEVVALVRREYAVLPGATGACIGGSSLGGLAALYAHFRHPDLFGGALCLSPSFWVGRGAIFRHVARRPTPPFSRVYLDAGALEGRGSVAAQAERMHRELAARGYPDGQLMWRPDKRGLHRETHWRRRLPKALRFMFRVG